MIDRPFCIVSTDGRLMVRRHYDKVRGGSVVVLEITSFASGRVLGVIIEDPMEGIQFAAELDRMARATAPPSTSSRAFRP